MIGDPSGKTAERTALPEEKVKSNAEAIKENIQRIFQNHQQFLWEKNRNPGTLKPVKYELY